MLAARSVSILIGTVARELSSQPFPSAGLALKLLGQLVPAIIAVDLVLSLIGRDRIRDHLSRDLVIVDVRVAAGVGVKLRAVNRDDP